MTPDATIEHLGVLSRIDALIAVLSDMKDAYVIDVGCGDGAVARALAARGARVSGYDAFIGDDHQDWAAEGPGAWRLRRGRADSIPEPDGCADVVVYMYSLHHVPKAELEKALRTASRLLKPSGRLCVIEPVPEGAMQYVSELYHDETAVRRDAKHALEQVAAPLFEDETVLHDFDSFSARALLGARFNAYRAEDVTSSDVKSRFAEMLAKFGGDFDQPARINMFSGRRSAH